jgi:hypothetical protein
MIDFFPVAPEAEVPSTIKSADIIPATPVVSPSIHLTEIELDSGKKTNVCVNLFIINIPYIY